MEFDLIQWKVMENENLIFNKNVTVAPRHLQTEPCRLLFSNLRKYSANPSMLSDIENGSTHHKCILSGLIALEMLDLLHR